MGMVTVKIWNVKWREGRPRFSPGPKLRRLLAARGLPQSFDLRHDDGQWYTLDECRIFAEAKRAEIAALKARRAHHPVASPARRTVADLFEQWYLSPKFTGGVRQGKREERGLSDSSIRDYKGKARVLLAFDPDLASSPPGAVSDVVAQGVYEALWEAKGLHMARGVVAVASSCWQWARRKSVLGVKHNPWLAVAKSTPAARNVVLDDFELTAWIAACDRPLPSARSSGRARRATVAAGTTTEQAAPPADRAEEYIARPELGDAIMLGLFTGQRQGDRLRLTAAGRDDAGRRLFKQSKTGAIVAIPETPALKARLDAAAERRKGLGIVDPHIVIDERARRPFKPDHYRHLIAARRAQAIRDCPSLAGKRDQDLRDTAVTWLARAGCTPYEIAAITGHSLASIHTILKHYLVLHPEMADAAIGKLVKWMDDKGMAV